MPLDPEIVAPADKAREIWGLLWSRLLTGIAITVPLIVTLWVLWLGYGFIAKISAPIWETLGVKDSTLLNFCTTLLLLLAVGFMGAHVIGQRLIDGVEALLMRVPIIAPLYGAVKQMRDSVRMMKSSASSRRVVFLEYPSAGSLLIGFVTGQYFEPTLQHEYLLVFLPMAPNPLAGFVVAVPAEKIIPCSLTFEEASKLIVSGGLVVPTPVGSVESPTPA